MTIRHKQKALSAMGSWVWYRVFMSSMTKSLQWTSHQKYFTFAPKPTRLAGIRRLSGFLLQVGKKRLPPSRPLLPERGRRLPLANPGFRCPAPLEDAGRGFTASIQLRQSDKSRAMVTLIPQPGDGNCAYHAARASISSALKHLVPESKGFTIDAKFVDSIFRETLFTVTRNLALAFHDQAQKVAKVPVTPQDCFQAVWDAGIDSPHLRLLLDGASSIRDYRGPDDIGTATEFARILIQDTEAAASKAIQAVLSHIYEHWADSQALALLALGLNVHILVTTRADWSLSPLYVAGSPQERSPVGLVLVYNGSTHYDNLQMDGSVAFAHVEYHDWRKPKWPSAGFLAKLKAHATSPTSAPIPSRVPCQQVPVATVATVTIQAVDATGTMSTCPVCCEHVRITRKGLRDGRHKCPGPSVSSTSAPSTAAPSTREPHTRAPRPSKPRGSGATHAPQLSPVVNPVSMVSSPVSPVLPVSPQVTPAVSTEMACRVQGCVESFHGAASLVDHLKETHGVHDSALDGLLASLSIFR